jgi:hypothetical protein
VLISVRYGIARIACKKPQQYIDIICERVKPPETFGFTTMRAAIANNVRLLSEPRCSSDQVWSLAGLTRDPISKNTPLLKEYPIPASSGRHSVEARSWRHFCGRGWCGRSHPPWCGQRARLDRLLLLLLLFCAVAPWPISCVQPAPIHSIKSDTDARNNMHRTLTHTAHTATRRDVEQQGVPPCIKIS